MNLLSWLNRKTKKLQPLRAQRSFDAGNESRFFSSWDAEPKTADQIVFAQLRPLRARSRDLVAKNSYAKRFIALAKNHVLGHQGIKLQVHAAMRGGEMDKQANGAIEGAWQRWHRAIFSDYQGRLSFNLQAQMILHSVIVDGEAFVRVFRGRNAGPFGFFLQIIDPEKLDIKHNATFEDGRFIRFGIEYTPNGRPLAYHLRMTQSAGPNYGYMAGFSPGTTRVSADDMYHIFIPEMVGQKRGLPWMATVLGDIKMLDGYMEAAVVNAREGASKMGFIMTPTNDEIAVDQNSVGEKFMDSEAGEWRQFPEGTSVHTYDPTYPNGEMPSFIKSVLRSISSGLGISYNTLANDLEGVNFSSMRHGAIEDRDGWRMLQEWLIDAFYARIYEQWLEMQLTLGTITAGGRPLDVAREQDFRNVEWQPRRWAWIDPLKEAQANQILRNMGVISRQEIIRDRGRDPESVDAEIQADEMTSNEETSAGRLSSVSDRKAAIRS